MNKFMDTLINHKKIFYLFIFILFIILELSLFQTHEHWSDEAQSWLIARDSSFTEIIEYIKYEGTPPLWVFITKICINLGLTYQFYSLVSIFATSIGLYLLLFKTDIPWYIKLLFPFTYPVFYQTTIIARSYCLILPGLMLIYLNYKHRFDHPLRFYLILLFFMNISLHTYLISGSIYVIYLYDYWKLKKENNNTITKNNKMILISFVLLFISFLLILIILFPDKYLGTNTLTKYNLIELLGEATFSYNSLIISIIASISIIFIILQYKDLEKILKIITIIVPILLLLTILYCSEHHLPIVFFIVFFIVIFNLNTKFSKIYIITLLILEIIWNINAVKFDYYNDYDGSIKAIDFLNDIKFYEKTIHAINFHVNSLQPYFNKNIYDNYGINSDKSYYMWKTNNGYDDTLNTLPDICIFNIIAEGTIENGTSSYKRIRITKKLLENNYVCYSFPGYHYYKFGISEINNFLIFVSPEINATIDTAKYKKFDIPEKYFTITPQK